MHEDNYYLLAYSEKYRGRTTYRIDRMETVDIENVDICAKALDMQGSVDEHVKQAFRMFGGRNAKVTLEFDRSLIGCIYDKFGENTKMVSYSDGIIRSTVRVQVAPTFFGWLAQFGDKMQIIEPENVREAYMGHIASIIGETN
jgi:predicted DNA-binding transcriptional regulator YafY